MDSQIQVLLITILNIEGNDEKCCWMLKGGIHFLLPKTVLLNTHYNFKTIYVLHNYGSNGYQITTYKYSNDTRSTATSANEYKERRRQKKMYLDNRRYKYNVNTKQKGIIYIG